MDESRLEFNGVALEGVISSDYEISATKDLYKATEWLLNRVELLLAGKPVRDMDECISYSKKALAKSKRGY
jgi:hypothetical protein